MKKIFTFISTAILLAAPALANQSVSTDCDGWEDGYPSYYCDCRNQSKVNMLANLNDPLDITITDTIWYATSSKLFLKGLTVYLFSDTNVKFIVTQLCDNSPGNGLYKDYVITSNQTRDVTSEDINKILAEHGATGLATKMYFCIAPEEKGVETRFILAAYGTGPESTCEDCLPMLPNMVLVSSHSGDVFELDPALIPENATATIDWISDGGCLLSIARGTCNYESDLEVDMPANSTYTIDAELLKNARDNQEKLYVYFWDNYGVGRVRLNVTVNEKPSEPNTPTGCDNLTAPTTDAHLVLSTNGELYILRDGVKYTVLGSKL